MENGIRANVLVVGQPATLNPFLMFFNSFFKENCLSWMDCAI